MFFIWSYLSLISSRVNFRPAAHDNSVHNLSAHGKQSSDARFVHAPFLISISDTTSRRQKPATCRFKSWLASIPDLDAIAKEQRRAKGKLHWWGD
jgi:hypothetical protein